MKFLSGIMIACWVFFSQCSTANAPIQNADELRQLINSRQYTFLAQNAQPVGGRQIPLNIMYTLRVQGDTLMSDLPYFGRAFVAPINPTDGSLNFTTTHFSYDVQNTRRGGYTINMDIEAERNASRMVLTVSANGYASLQVLSPYRQPISFRGIVQPAAR